ncbi:MAG: folylpolyglutamate synthase/dihydrofolate synthase family protein [Planctomycetaceae bacterium]
MAKTIDTYDAAIDFLYSRINYERVDSRAYSTSDFKLDRMKMLLALLDNPHERFPAVHVAGTKGKGSTCTMIASVMAAAGHKVGLYISPHISAFEERMTVNGVRPSPTQLVELVRRLLPAVTEMDSLSGQMQPTYFELATALAWLYFAESQADFVVLETGLGGRLDSTSVCCPRVCVITNVSRDHTQILGSTVRQIAWEKGGIIKPGVPLVCGITQPDALELIEQLCRERQSRLILLNRNMKVVSRRLNHIASADTSPVCSSVKQPNSFVDLLIDDETWTDIPVALRGTHQATNTILAFAAIQELRSQGWNIDDAAIRTGLANVEWPARVEVVAQNPIVIVDAAHNWESARALIGTLKEDFAPTRRILIFAATRDKDVAGLLRQMIPAFDTVILTRYLDNPRSVPVEELQSMIHAISNRQVHTADTPTGAWQIARKLAKPTDLIAITGSFFLVAELRDLVIEQAEANAVGTALKS